MFDNVLLPRILYPITGTPKYIDPIIDIGILLFAQMT